MVDNHDDLWHYKIYFCKIKVLTTAVIIYLIFIFFLHISNLLFTHNWWLSNLYIINSNDKIIVAFTFEICLI